MSLSESEKKPDMPLLPIARKQSDSNAFTATPFPMKDCGSKLSFVDNEPPSKALKTTIPHSSSPNHPRPSPLPHKNKSCGHSLFIVASSSSSKYSPPHSPHYHRPFIDYNNHHIEHHPYNTKKSLPFHSYHHPSPSVKICATIIPLLSLHLHPPAHQQPSPLINFLTFIQFKFSKLEFT
jgi:hypothetical protein